MTNLNTVQNDIAKLPPDKQETVFNFIAYLIEQNSINLSSKPEVQTQDWSDFVGCMAAEPDLARNHKTYLSQELGQKYDHC